MSTPRSRSPPSFFNSASRPLLVVEVGYNTWGWVHVIGGVIVILAGTA